MRRASTTLNPDERPSSGAGCARAATQRARGDPQESRRRPRTHGHDGHCDRVRRAVVVREALPGAEPVDGADAARRRPHPGRALPLPPHRPESRRHHRVPPQRAGLRCLPDRPRLEPELRQAPDRPAERVGRIVRRQGLRLRDAGAGEQARSPPSTPGCSFLKESYTTSPTGQCSSTTGDFGPRHLGHRPVPDARRQPPVLRGLALLGRRSTARRSSGAPSRSTGRPRASRVSEHRASARVRRDRDRPARARRRRGGSRLHARRHRPLGRARIAERGDRPSSTRLPPRSRTTLSGYGLGLRARAVAGRPARARRARGRAAGRASRCSAITTPSSRSAPSRGARCGARATGCIGPGSRRHEGRAGRGGARGAAARRRRPALRAARARLRARRGDPLGADRHPGAAGGLRRRPVHGVRPPGRGGRGRAQGRPLARRRRARALGTRRIRAGARAQRRARAGARAPAHRRARRRTRGADAARHAHARRRRAQFGPRRGARDDRHARLARGRPRLGRGRSCCASTRTAM